MKSKFSFNLRRLFHRHRDPNYILVGVNVYYLCRCGAKRVRRAYSNLDGPTDPNWPPRTNKHGFPVDDTGWVGGFGA